jgi:hypothetical protein
MKRLFGLAIVSAALIAADISGAMAGCLYGNKSLPGSINAGRSDGQRFYTSSGGPITIGVYSDNGPLRVFMPGCGWRFGTTHTCTTYAGYGSQVHPVIVNPNPYTVTYSFTCD